MEVVLSDNTVIESALIIYPWRDDWMFPLGQLSDALGFGINVSAALATAEGFVLREENTFYLDVNKCRVRLKSEAFDADCNQMVVFQDEIYVSRNLFEKWFPANFHVNSLRSQILVYTREKLPLQERREREQLAQRSKGLTLEFDPGYPRVAVPYAPLDGFFFDEQLGYTHRIDSGTNTGSLAHTTQLGGEVGGLEAYGFASGSQRKVNDWRITFSRRSPTGEALGPFSFREAQFFDVTLPSLPLISLSSPARGFLFSNYPFNIPNTFQYQDFEGPLLPGWEVAVYRNDVLLDRQLGEQGGRYHFRNIALLYGRNVFRFAFFGPQGQRYDEYQSFYIGPDMLQPGTRNYRMGFGQTRDNHQRLTLQYSENLKKYFTLGAAFLYEPRPSDSFASISLTQLNDLFLLNALCAVSTHGGTACELSPIFGVGTASVGARYTYLFDRFRSYLYNSGTNITQRSETAATVNYVIPTTPSIGMTWELLRKDYIDSPQTNSLRNLLSFSPGKFLWNNEISYQFNDATPLAGRWEVIYFETYTRYRIGQEYSNSRVLSAEAEVQYAVDNNISLGSVVGYRFDVKRPVLQLTATKYLPAFSVGANFTVEGKNNYSIGAVLGFSVLREPLQRQLHLSFRPQAQMGAASVRVFVDNNRNGHFDKEDIPLPNMSIVVNQGTADVNTDRDGVAFLTQLRPQMPADISLSPSSLADPFLRLAQPGVRIIPRAGKTAQVELPLLVFGYADGVINFPSEKKPRSHKGIELELVAPSGEVIGRTRTDREGYYVFEELRPGRYAIRISHAQLEKLEVEPTPLYHVIKIPPSGAFETNRDFSLETGED